MVNSRKEFIFERSDNSMDDKETGVETEIPSMYDYFYYDFAILKKALSIRKNVIENQDEVILTGYIYFIEFCLGKLIQNVEEAPYNQHIFEIVNWGRLSINDEEIRHLKETSHSFKLVFDLNELRGLFSGLRRKLTKSDDAKVKQELKAILEKTEILNDEINSEMKELYNAQKITSIDESTEKLMIFHWFMVTYVYEPPRMFFSTMTDQVARSFTPELQYLAGFKFCTEYIMNWLTENKYSGIIKEGLSELNTLIYIHEFYSKMHGTVFKDVKSLRIFDVTEPKWEAKELLKDRKITRQWEVNVIFRAREIKVINVEEISGFRSDRDAIQRLFINALFGAIELDGPKVEIVQFEEFVEDGKDWDKYYSYALYLPMHGMVGDASSWLIFNKLDGESSWESWDNIRRHIQNTMKNRIDKTTFREYKIESGVLKKYIDNNDLVTIRKIDTETRLDTNRGLLAEFLGYFYLWKKYGAKLIEFHKEGNETDADVVADDGKNRYLLQAKNSLSVNRKQLREDLDKIIKQFDKIGKTYMVDGITTKKILFVMDWSWNMKKAMEVEDWETYTMNTHVLASKYLKNTGIELVVYTNIKLIEGGYKDFIMKVEEAFGLINEDKLK
jgi:hypothetical protein